MEHGPYNRRGGPGGPPSEVTALAITMKDEHGNARQATLLDGGSEATELGLLRAVCRQIGAHWGQDDLGWWAVIPD